VIFFDRSILKPVVDAVKGTKGNAVWLEDVFKDNPSIGETEWMPVIGELGYLTILRDKHVRTRTEERRAIQESNLGCFNFIYKKNKSRWQTLQLVCATLDEMEDKFANTPRPFMYMINGNGVFKKFDL
jgi:hypothetical protein